MAIEHGKFAATTGSINMLDEFLDMGYRFINIGADVVGMHQYCSSLMKTFNSRKK